MSEREIFTEVYESGLAGFVTPEDQYVRTGEYRCAKMGEFILRRDHSRPLVQQIKSNTHKALEVAIEIVIPLRDPVTCPKCEQKRELSEMVDYLCEWCR